jgi:hypothetical protein
MPRHKAEVCHFDKVWAITLITRNGVDQATVFDDFLASSMGTKPSVTGSVKRLVSGLPNSPRSGSFVSATHQSAHSSNGLKSVTPIFAKSPTFRLTKVNPALIAVAAIHASRSDLGSGMWRPAQIRATSRDKANVRCS